VGEVGEPERDEASQGSASQGTAVGVLDPGRGTDEWADLRPLFTWIAQRRPVVIGAVVLIIAQLAWRAHFLGHLYFHQDDYFNLDLAARSPLSWHYLTFVGVGHFMIGQRILAWLLVKASLYDWGLASALVLAILAVTDVAVFLLLRRLFSERPAILVLLTIYLLYPLAVPDFGYWTAATESVPLQLAIVLALYAHLNYLRSGRRRDLAAAAGWVVIALIFLEKGLVLPVLLFAVTAFFCTDARSLFGGIGRAFVRYRLAWAVYAVILVCYGLLLTFALHTAASGPELPTSISAIWTYLWAVVKDVLLPGAVGGPWQWLRAGGAYALAAPPTGLAWLSVVITIAVLLVTSWRRPAAWRAWAILAGWVIAADLLPVILRRINGSYPILFALDTRYLAELAVVGTICLGFAVLPLTALKEDPIAEQQAAARRTPLLSQQVVRAATTAVVAIFVVGSLWSAQAYVNATSGSVARSYISQATSAIDQAAKGTPVVNVYVPDSIFVGYHEKYGLAATVIGEIDPGKLAWISQPDGTIHNLSIFGPGGKLRPAWVYGASSGRATAKDGCWPVKHGKIIVKFLGNPPYLSTALRIGYIWGGSVKGTVTVRYGHTVRQLPVLPGLHAGYLPVAGTAPRITVSGMAGTGLCIGDVEAGDFAPQAS
jgi:hypothetical protein